MGKKKAISGLKYAGGFLAVFVFVIVIINTHGIFDSDLLWHYKMGEDIVHSHQIISENTYSWIEGTYWNQQEWLYDVIFYLIVSKTGLVGYQLMFAVCMTVIFYIGYRQNKNNIRHPVLYFIVSGFILAAMPTNIINRPVWYSSFIFVFLFWVYEKQGLKRFIAYFLSGVFIANLHCGTVIIAAAFLIIQFVLDIICRVLIDYKKGSLGFKYIGCRLSGIVLFLAGSCVNPLGPKQLLNMLRATRLGTLKYIQEWQPIEFDNFIQILTVMIILLSFGYALKHSWQSRDVMRIGIISAFLALALYSMKSSVVFIYLYIVYGYEYTENMLCDFILQFSEASDWDAGIRFTKKSVVTAAVSGCAASCAVFSIVYGVTFDKFVYDLQKKAIPDNMITYLQEHSGERLLHGYICGNCLLWNDIKVFVDTRQHPYAKEFGYASSMDAVCEMKHTKDFEIMDDYFDEYQFTEVLSTQDFDIDWYMTQRDDFKCIYSDEDTKSALYVKQGA